MGNYLYAPSAENSFENEEPLGICLASAESPKAHRYYFDHATKIPIKFYKGIDGDGDDQ